MTVGRRPFLAAALAIPFAGALPRLAPAGEADIYGREIYAPDGVALAGYDAVAYFTDGRAVPGSPDNALRWRGADWHFASAATREAFEMNPYAYAPEYGGYCAWDMAKGELTSSAPEAFAVVGGRLFMLQSVAFLTIWKRDTSVYIARADAQWARR